MTKEQRDIGVTVSNNLRLGFQCNKVARTAATVLGQISWAFHNRDRHTYMNLYNQCVSDHLWSLLLESAAGQCKGEVVNAVFI
jgi:hypothetical protein